jgi:yersiniabactin nonribosomal peptide synthetase
MTPPDPTREQVFTRRPHDVELSPARLALLEELRRGEHSTAEEPIDISPLPRSRLSPEQERIWALEDLFPMTSQHNLAAAYSIRGTLDTAALEASLGSIVQRHEPLRTVFCVRQGERYQEPQSIETCPLAIEDLQHLPSSAQAAAVQQAINSAANQHIDIATPPLCRATLIRTSPTEHVLVLVVHHIAADGWSLGVLIKELSTIYARQVRGEAADLPPIPVRFRDCAEWLRRMQSGQEATRALGYHRQELAGELPVLEMPLARSRPPTFHTEAGTVRFMIDEELRRAVDRYAAKSATTAFATLFAAFQVLLFRFSGRSDIVTGTATAGRVRSEFDNLIGCFFNTLAIRTQLEPQWSFDECVRAVSRKVRGTMANQTAPFQDVVRTVLRNRSPGRAPVFQSMFAFQNAPIPTFELPNAAVSRMHVDMHATQLDLTLLIDIAGAAYDAKIWYCKALFDESTVASFCQAYVELLRDAVTRPTTSLQALRLLSKQARDAEIAGSGRARSSVPWQRVDERIVEIAQRRPGAVSVTQADNALTYGELMRRASQVAQALYARGVSRGSRVAVLLERTVELPAALLGVQLTGAAYVPLSDALPTQRLEVMCADARVDAFLVHASLGALIHPLVGDKPVVTLNDIAWSGEASFEASADRSADDAVYVIFTSGSTGRPKGVQVLHRSLANLVCAIALEPGFAASDTLISQAALTFDMSPLEIFLPLCCGGSVEVLPRQALRDPQLFADRLRQSRATHLQATPSLLQMLLNAGWLPERQLKIWCGGEALPKGLAAALLKRVNELYNLYGPTECTVWTSIGRVEREDAIDVGTPIANTRLYILDVHGDIVPRGVIGEIVIAGEAVAQGYVTESALREQRFADDTILGTGRLYRTGDLGRRRQDGRIEIIGRNDQQVKVRGYRIELGEIEASLSVHPAVRAAAVLVQQHGLQDRRLIAYIAWKSTPAAHEQGQWLDDVSAFLAKRLPAYMLPAALVTLDELPLTESGKIDRQALAKQPGSQTPHRSYTAPRSELERTLCELWKSILRVERVGVRDNFFELGGHSILATQLLVATQEATGQRIEMQQLYLDPTVEGMAAEIERRGAPAEQEHRALPQLIADEHNAAAPFPLTEVQQAYLVGRYDAFALGNISTHLYAEFDMPDLDLERLGAAFNRLIARHGMLRAVFSRDAQQRILAQVPAYVIRQVALADLEDDAARTARAVAIREEMSHQVFACDQWPLFELRVTDLDGRTARLHLSIDLLLADAMSLQVLHRELFKLYQHPEASLPDIRISFRDYVLAKQQLKTRAFYAKCEQYWTGRIDTIPPGPELPIIKEPGAVARPRFIRRQHVLSREARRSLDHVCRSIGVTTPTFALSVCAAVLNLWSKTNRFTINIPLLNRYGSFESIQHLVGDFTSLLMLEVGIDPTDTFVANARKIQQQLWADMEHREYDGVSLLREITRRNRRQGPQLMPVVFTSALNLIEDPAKGGTQTSNAGLPQPTYAISQTSQAWLDCQLWEQGGELLLAWDAIDELFAPRVADEMFRTFVSCLEAMSADSAQLRLRDLIRVPDGQASVHAAANATQERRSGELLHARFVEQVARGPSAPALLCGTRVLTYEQLDRRARLAARELVRREAGPNDLVAVCMQKGWEQIVAVLAVLYSGAAYVPIDASLPDARIRQLLELCHAKALLTQPQLAARLAPMHAQAIVIDELDAPSDEALDDFAPRSASTPQDLAYVIFTSGSTGVPKGVMIDHRGALNTINDINTRCGVTRADRVLALSSLSFDLSVYDIFGPLSVGGAIVLPQAGREADPAHWAQLVVNEAITVWNSVPALARLYVDQLAREQRAAVLPLRWVLLSGDWIPLSLAEALQGRLPAAKVLSLGGATEASIWSICYPIEKISSEWKSIPYGRALTNQSVHVLKGDLSAAPDWSVGELYIGGSGVAKGYLGDAHRTNAQFLVHPDTQQRLYRTGDLGRWLPDGTIEFLGREDSQVKIAGHRIELGEIEAALRRDDTLADCLVAALGDTSNKRLVAYVVPVDAGGSGGTEGANAWDSRASATLASSAESSRWREGLRLRLPDYMVPQLYVKLERMPLTPNGKIDRRALPLPDARPEEARYVEPTTAIERALCLIWQKALVVDRVGIHDNFFELGGDSILAVQIANGMERELGIHMPFKQFITTPTVAALAANVQSQPIETELLARQGIAPDSGQAGEPGARSRREDPLAPADAKSTTVPTIGQIAAYVQAQPSDGESLGGVHVVPDAQHRYEPFPLTEVQQSFVLGRSNAFEIGNVSIHRYAEFDLENLDYERLSLAFNRLVERHEMLRAVLRTDDTQSIVKQVPAYSIPIADLRAGEQAAVAAELAKTRAQMSDQVLPLSAWPPFDLRLSRLSDARWRLHASVDLVNFDGRSLEILATDLSHFYASPHEPLRAFDASYRDYIMAREALRRSEAYTQAKGYWLDRLDSLPAGPDLPLAQAPEAIAKPRFVRKTLQLDREAWSSFKASAASNGISASAALLSAFALVLKRWSATAHFTLNLTLSDRPRYPQVFDLVGDFTSVLLLEVGLGPTSTFVENAKALQLRLWNDLEHSQFSGVDVLREMNSRAGRAHGVRMPIVFTYVTDAGSRRGAEERPIGELASQLREHEVYAITQTPQVWLDHQVIDRDGILDVNWDYVDELFKEDVVDAMFEAYQQLLRQLAVETSWNRPFAVALPAPQERVRQLVNATQVQTRPERLEVLFARQAQTRPEAAAVVTQQRTITYAALDRASRRLAHELTTHGVRANELVAVVMEKGWEQIVAVLGVLRSGAAYVPVDAALPQTRVLQLLEESSSKVALTQAKASDALALSPVLPRVVVSEALLDGEDVPFAPIERPPTDLAYVIYTSGSTGKPKGVMIDHCGAANTILDINRRFGVSCRDRVLAVSSLSFDLSVYDIFGTLAAGGTIVVPQADRQRDAAHWRHLIDREGVTIWNSAPALAQMYLEGCSDEAIGASLRLIMLSGDWIALALVSRSKQLAPQATFVSLGGATEASIWSIGYVVDVVDERWKSVPYGKPLANQTFHVLDETREDCPDWVAGSLFIGGIGLAQGYWLDAATTKSRFIVHPRYGRLYDTGDAGRYLPDGNIEFLGRRDTQIKLHGHRIELGEIESVLGERADVQHAVVVLEGDGAKKQLGAYIQFRQEPTPPPAQPEEHPWRLADVTGEVDTAMVDEIGSVETLEATVTTQNTFYRDSVCRALIDMGLFQGPQQTLSVDDVVLKGRISPRYHRWVQRALEYLTTQGLLRADNAAYCRAAPLERFHSSHVLEDLSDVLREDKHSAELYLHESTEINYQVYFDEAHRIASSLFERLIARLDPRSPVRILEVGAGLGSLTRHLLPLLKNRDVSYTFTDISQYFLSKAADDYASSAFMEYELLDLDTDPTLQGFWPHSFDIIIASSVLHALKSIDASLKHILSLLSSRGVLLFIEETKFFPFFDLSMGLQQGFDSFSDQPLRVAHPLMSREGWRAAAQRSGFAEFEHLHRAGSFAEFFGLDVLVARAPRMRQHADAATISQYLRSRLPQYMVPKSLYAIARVPLSSNGKVDRAALAARKTRKRRSGHHVAARTPAESTLCALWAENLELERVGIRDNYFEIGGDSLLATRLVSRVSASFGLDVPIKTLFEHSTVESFAIALNGLTSAVVAEIPKADRERYRI